MHNSKLHCLPLAIFKTHLFQTDQFLCRLIPALLISVINSFRFALLIKSIRLPTVRPNHFFFLFLFSFSFSPLHIFPPVYQCVWAQNWPKMEARWVGRSGGGEGIEQLLPRESAGATSRTFRTGGGGLRQYLSEDAALSGRHKKDKFDLAVPLSICWHIATNITFFAPNSNIDVERPQKRSMANLCRFSRLFFAALLLLMLCSLFMAEAAIWRMRTDKKAMRNALVRFGKRNAYRPAGEAFVGTAGFGDGGAHLLRDMGMDDRQTQWAAFGDTGAANRRNVWLWPEE